MAKVNIVDQVQTMENEDKVKELISKQVRLPATIIGGKKSDGKETVQYAILKKMVLIESYLPN